MTVVLIILAALGTILFGYFVLRRLDIFLERGGILDSPQGRANQGLLVYGAPEVAEKIKKSGMKCKSLMTLSFPEDGYYSALFALSEDDFENLAMCQAAKRADPGIYTVARCSVPGLRHAFEAEGTGLLLDADESIDGLLAGLRSIER